MKIVAVILTYNEEQHLARCIESLTGVVVQVVVADSFSSDGTLGIARAYNARVIQNPWISHASQFNWALTQLDPDTDWVLRIDADETLTPELRGEIATKLSSIDRNVDGIHFNRRIVFQGRPIRFGGVFPIRVLRLFRYGRGQCEDRWMDEHIKVRGKTIQFQGEIVDENLNSLSWWTNKHNGYASYEAIELLNLEFQFMRRDSSVALRGGTQASMKRWLKEEIYFRLPVGFRAWCYFFYRYVFRLGFLDGPEGMSFHVLQGFWYRFLVDQKVEEVRRYMAATGGSIEEAIQSVLHVKLPKRTI